MKNQIKVMSFNLRMDTEHDGINRFRNRIGRVMEVINTENPDVIGFQEVTPTMREWLVETLADYYTVGAGRNADYSGESALIAYKKSAFDLISCESIMLSSTPHIMGSRYEGVDQSRCPRVYTRLLLKHKDIREPIYFYNVHTDHEGQLARTLATVQLLQDICSHNRNFVMTGDFNAQPDDREIKMLTAATARRVLDVSETVGGTFHNYGRLEMPVKIDYIFTDARNKVIDCSLIEDKPVNEVYLSDHNPLFAVLEIR